MCFQLVHFIFICTGNSVRVAKVVELDSVLIQLVISSCKVLNSQEEKVNDRTK